MRRPRESQAVAKDWEARKLAQGEASHKRGDSLNAMRLFKQVLDRNPRCWPAVFGAAVLAHQVCEHEWAIRQLRRMVKANPTAVEAWFNLGTILQCVGGYVEAVGALERAVQLRPSLVGARVNLGNALLGLGRTEEAFAAYEAARLLPLGSAESAWNLSHSLILTGQWKNGWAAYEYRFQIPGFVEMNAVSVDASRTDLPLPWRGAPLNGKRLVVVAEQGWGDALMCLRYAATLRALGAITTWAVRPELVRLVERSVAPDPVVSTTDPLPSADYCVTCMSLHHRLGITPETVPGAHGYLRAA